MSDVLPTIGPASSRHALVPTPDEFPLPQLELDVGLPPDRPDEETVSGGLVVYTPPSVSDEWDDTNTDTYTPDRLAPAGAPKPDDDVPVLGRIDLAFPVRADQTVQQAVEPIHRHAVDWLESRHRARFMMAATDLVRVVLRALRTGEGRIVVHRDRTGEPIKLTGFAEDEPVGERIC